MTGEAKLISVIIPAYNAERHLAEAIESALNQTYRPVEVIVINDGSTDDTEGVAHSFGERITCLSQENKGLSGARNRGIEVALGDFLAFLDADDFWETEKLSKQMAAFEADPQLDLVFSHMVQFSDEDPEQKRSPQPAPLPSTMLIRRESFFRVGLFDPKLIYAEFVPWYARVKELELCEAMVQEVLLNRRIHNDNMGVRDRHKLKDYARLLKDSIDRKRALKP